MNIQSTQVQVVMGVRGWPAELIIPFHTLFFLHHFLYLSL